MKAYFERPSLRGIARALGAARQTLSGWLKEQGNKHADLAPTLSDVTAQEDVLECDELPRLVQMKSKALAPDWTSGAHDRQVRD